MSAAFAACTPETASSTEKHRSAGTPSSRGGKEDLWMGLAAMGEIPSRDVRVENVEQGDARPDEVVAKTLAIGEGMESDLAE